MKKRCIALILSAIMAVMLAGCGGNAPGSDSEITIKIGTVTSENAPVSKALMHMKEELEEKSDGRIFVQLYFGGQLGGEQEMLELARVGDIQMVTSAHLNMSGTIHSLAALESYFLFDNYDHAFRFMDSPGGQAMLDAYQQMDMQGLGFFPNGFRQFTNNKRPIESVQDLKGLKIRGYSPVQIAAWEALGLNMTAVNWNELFTSMQQNLVDGQESALSSIYEQKFYEVQHYISLTSHLISSDILVCNQPWLESLSTDDQKLIEDAVANAVTFHRENLVEQENTYIQAFEEYGTQVNEVPQETRDQMKQMVDEVVNPAIIDLAGQETFDLVQEWVEKTRE